MNRIMITTSARVASNMTAQGFNLRCRNFQTGRFLKTKVLDCTMDTSGIFSIDEVNQTIVERRKKVVANTVSCHYVQDNRSGSIVAGNHTVYDAKQEFDNNDPFVNGKDLLYRCTKANLLWRNVCYEIYA